MRRKVINIMAIVIVALLMVAIVSFYLYDVVFLKEEITTNLFRTIIIVFMLFTTLMKLIYGKGRKSLNLYEKAYEKELGFAFKNKPMARKKLLCACRLYDESNYRKSLKYLFQLLKEAELERDVVPVLLFIALCYTDAGLPKEAIKVYYDALKYDPNNEKIHSNLGILYIGEGDFEMALQHYNKAIECNPNHYYAYINRANYYFRVHSFEKAIEDAQKALEIKNNGREAASLLTIIFAIKQDKENKEKYYHIAISSGENPRDLNEAIEYYLNEVKQDEQSEEEKQES